MNKTAIARKDLSAPMRYMIQRRGAPYGPTRVLHFGEGKAYHDTRAIFEVGNES